VLRELLVPLLADDDVREARVLARRRSSGARGAALLALALAAGTLAIAALRRGEPRSLLLGILLGNTGAGPGAPSGQGRGRVVRLGFGPLNLSPLLLGEIRSGVGRRKCAVDQRALLGIRATVEFQCAKGNDSLKKRKKKIVR
jgi:hypothetical protein